MKRKVYILISIFVLLFVSCKKDEYFMSGDAFVIDNGEFLKTTAPYVTTINPEDVTINSAMLGGNVLMSGNLEMLARGFCISTKRNPTIEDRCIESSSVGVGYFTCNADNLSSNTIYYVRAYATNKKGTTYGEEKSFKTKEPEKQGKWIYYDNGVYESSFAYAVNSPIYWGVCFPNTYLENYEGYRLNKVLLYIYSSNAYKVNMEVYVGGVNSPGNMVLHSEARVSSTSTINTWEDFQIAKYADVEIDSTQSLWITFNAYSTSMVKYPAAACSYVGNPNSDWISLDGITWEHMSDHDLNYSWMIRAYLEDDKGRTVVLDLEN